MGDPEKPVDAAAEFLAEVLASQKARRRAEAVAKEAIVNGKVVKLDMTQGARVRGAVSYPGKPKVEAFDLEAKAEKEAGGADAAEDEDEEAVRSEAPSAVKALGLAEAKRRFMIRRLKLQEINHKYAVIRSYGGKCVVVTTGRSPLDPNKKVFVIQSREAFEQWKANDFIPSLEKSDKTEPVGPWWWRHPKRLQYDGVVFEPLAPRIVKTSDRQLLFNTYLGWGVKPKPGDWSLIRRHIREVLANGDPKTEDYIIRWTAWSIQHPDLLPLVALVLIGLKGRGKGTFARALERIFGDHSLQISSQRHIVGNFNAHLENLILMISDEAYWAGHKADAGTLQRCRPSALIGQNGLIA